MTLNKSLLIPLVVFVLLVGILAVGFSLEDPHLLPSELVDEPFPEFELRQLHHPAQTSSREDFVGRMSLVNVWATWCITCRHEHGYLVKLAARGVPIYGINYKDDRAKAQGWLSELGNPYVFSAMDIDGRLGVDLGVFGAPETYFVDANGVIRYKHVGEVNEQVWTQDIEPLFKQYP